MAALAAVPFALCLLQNIIESQIILVQNFTFTTYPVSLKDCPQIDINNEVTFNLYTNKNPDQPQSLYLGNDLELQLSNFDFNLPTVIFFHGFTESINADDSQQLKRSFLESGDYNVILVNSQRVLAGLYYYEAVQNCKFVGKFGAQFVDYLVSKGLDLNSLHVIGFSLGAQISGFVGQYVTAGRLPRITGLDPAGPLYNGQSTDEKLDKSDADFVDVIHTNAGLFGNIEESGHVDFWPNGASFQPGCELPDRLYTRQPFSLNEFVFCDHYRAYKLFARSLTDPFRYPAKTCIDYGQPENNNQCDESDIAYMGIAANHSYSGNYYIYTGTDAQEL